MKNNFKNIALGLLALGLFGAFVGTTNNTSGGNEVGRYVPIVNHSQTEFNFNILDTKTGRVYFTNDNLERVYWDYVNGAKPSK